VSASISADPAAGLMVAWANLARNPERRVITG
jgi:hypothetical protein